MSTEKLTQCARAVLDAWGDAGWTPAFDAARRALRAEVEAAEALAAVPVEPPAAWQVWWGLGYMRLNSVHIERKTAEEAAATIKSYTEIRPLYAHPAPQPKRCPYCDDTGDVHSADGEWRGVCTCPAGAAPQPQQAGYALVPIDPTLEMQAAWNGAGEYWQAAYSAMLAAAPQPQQAAQSNYSHAEVLAAHTEGYKLGLIQVDRPQPQQAGNTVSVAAYDRLQALVDAQADRIMRMDSPPECTSTDRWNCKYCQKISSCDAISDLRNFAATPPQPTAPAPCGNTPYDEGPFSLAPTNDRLSPFDAVARAMDLASLLAGSVAMSNAGQAGAYSARLRSHLIKYIYPAEAASAAQKEPT